MSEHDNNQSERSKRAQQQSLPLSWDADERPAQPDRKPVKKPDASTPDATEPRPKAESTPIQSTPVSDSDKDLARDERKAKQMPKTPKERVPERKPVPAEDADIVRLGDVETSLGQTLLEARGARNLSTSQVSQKTKIPKDFIERVEADQIDRLPPPVYARSYISQLCREYGIAPAPLLEEYEHAVGREVPPEPQRRSFILGPETDESPTVQYRPRIQREVVTGKMLQTISRFAVLGALVLLVLLVLVAVGYQQIKNYRQRQDTSVIADDQQEQVSIDVEEYITPQQLPLIELDVPETNTQR